MDIHTILAFLGVSFALAMTPGADWAYAISAGLGRHKVSFAVAGLCSGYLFHTVLIVAGMSALVAGNPRLLSWLTLAGAAYLLWLGISTARTWRGAGFTAEKNVPVSGAAEAQGGITSSASNGGTGTLLRTPAQPDAAPRSRERFLGPAFFRGLGTSGTNPKALLLYVALIPQFIHADAAFSVPGADRTAGHQPHGAVDLHLHGCRRGCQAVAAPAPAAARFITLTSGLIMIGLGLLLVIEQAPILLASIQMLMSLIGN